MSAIITFDELKGRWIVQSDMKSLNDVMEIISEVRK
jgi:hypothetical protein